MHKIGIYYDENGLREIMKGQGIATMEQQIMMSKLSQIKAEFLQAFGFDGTFEIRRVDTRSKRSRTTFRIVPTNAKTTAALKSKPRWLDKFTN